MRNKPRPIKSTRHKSVTSLKYCPRTTFEQTRVGHMDGVMRLAFLENNDISPETWNEIDFNSLSTASILKRNIQQQLQIKQQQQLLLQQQEQLQHQQEQLQQLQHQQLQQQQQQQHQHKHQIHPHQQPQHQLILQHHEMVEEDEEDDAETEEIEEEEEPPSPAAQHEESEPLANQSSTGGFMCDEPNCGKSFPSSRKLRHHQVVHSDEFPFHCQFKGCDKKFKRKFGIDLHSTTHFDLDPEMYSKTSNNSSLPFFGRRMQYSMCKPCGEKFKTVHDYQNHMLGHGKEPFKCPVKDCGQTFSIWKSFQKHRASHYFNYYCKMDPRCTHSTSNLQLLKLHIYCCHFQRKLPNTCN